MNHTQQIIQDAIEGGWEPCDIIDDYKSIIVTFTNGGVWIKNDPLEDGCHFDNSQSFLDPLFWQAVGKTRGWSDSMALDYYDKFSGAEEWDYRWHQFIDNLRLGDDYETALGKLV